MSCFHFVLSLLSSHRSLFSLIWLVPTATTWMKRKFSSFFCCCCVWRHQEDWQSFYFSCSLLYPIAILFIVDLWIYESESTKYVERKNQVVVCVWIHIERETKLRKLTEKLSSKMREKLDNANIEIVYTYRNSHEKRSVVAKYRKKFKLSVEYIYKFCVNSWFLSKK